MVLGRRRSVESLRSFLLLVLHGSFVANLAYLQVPIKTSVIIFRGECTKRTGSQLTYNIFVDLTLSW